MSKVEVLVATMNQTDFSKLNEMNIKSDVIFANQTNRNEYSESNVLGAKVRMFSTDKRGVGRNRNLALLFSEGEICLLSDDDVVYVDNYEQKIESAFNKLPKADIIIFNIETIGKKTDRRQNTKIKRVKWHNFLNYGAVRIAFRRESILRNNIWFSLKFGGGTLYGSGEDSLFLRDSLKKNMRIFTYPEKIAFVNQETSTWFKGYNEKYFFDKGAFLSAAFPIMKYLIAIYYSYKYKSKAEYSFKTILTYMTKGIKAFNKDVCYEKS